MQPANLLPINSLGEGWYDKDHVLLHACFQLLTDFVEQEMQGKDYPDWNATEESRRARKEIGDLYSWWQERKLRDDLKGREEPDYLQDNEMLHRLIDVRMHLWT